MSSLRRMTTAARTSRPGGVVVLLVTAALLASGAGTFGAFTATRNVSTSLSAHADWLPPVINATVAGSTSGSATEHLKRGSTYYLYADVAADRGNPAAGVASVTADASGLTAGQTAVALTAGSYSFGGVSYNYRSGALTVDVTPPACRYRYPTTVTDAASPANTATRPTLAPSTDRDLLTDYNIRLDGPTATDSIGQPSSAGDVNNDGKDDVIVGNPNADNNGADSGSAYVIFGRTTDAIIDLATVGTNGFRIDGAASNDKLGGGASAAGDVNADGYDDVVVSAQGADNNGRGASGSAYVVFGSANPVTVNLSTLGASAGYRIDGASSSGKLGDAVANAGDVNGDGRADVVVGEKDNDRAYVVFGKTDGTTVDLNGITGFDPAKGYKMTGPNGSVVGRAVSGVGDVNKDGYADVLVGGHRADLNGRTDSGSAYLVHGKTTATTIDLTSYTSGFRIDGATADAKLGISVSAAGDVNADGTPDLLVTASGSKGVVGDERNNSGSAFVIFGKTTSTTVDTAALGSAGYQIRGAAVGDEVAQAVGIGDVNADGKADALIGADAADPGGRLDAGAAYVVFGKSDTAVIDLLSLGASGYLIQGAVAGDMAGDRVANAGDTNGDGRTDFIVTAPTADNNSRTDSGSAYLLHGPSCRAANYATAPRSTAGLIAHWPLSETSGTTANDTKALMPNNGTYTNGPALEVSGRFSPTDKAVSFDGVDDYVNFRNPTAFQITTGTIEAWVKTSSPGSSYRGVLVKNSAYGMFLKDGVLMAYDWGAGADRSTGVNLADGQWHHVVTTFSSGVVNGTKIYSDGVLRLTTTITVSNNAQQLQVAANNAAQFFAGSIDEPAIYDRELTAAQITSNYNARTNACETYPPFRNAVWCTSGLTNYWRLGESSGTAAADATGANQGTYGGGLTLASSGALPNDPNTAPTFDGTDDTVTLSGLTGVNTAAGAYNTVEFWMYWTGTNAQMPFGFNSYDLYFAAEGFGFNTAAGDVWGISTAGLANRWVHVAAAFYNGDAKKSRLWIDGAEQTLTQRRNTTGSATATTSARISGWATDTGYKFGGKIDEVAMYNRRLTTGEVLTHYHAR